MRFYLQLTAIIFWNNLIASLWIIDYSHEEFFQPTSHCLLLKSTVVMWRREIISFNGYRNDSIAHNWRELCQILPQTSCKFPIINKCYTFFTFFLTFNLCQKIFGNLEQKFCFCLLHALGFISTKVPLTGGKLLNGFGSSFVKANFSTERNLPGDITKTQKL